MPSAKILERKKKVVKDLAAELKDAQSIVLTDYQGLTVEQDTEMREAFRSADVKYKVVKNQVIKRAFESMGIELDQSKLIGPTALAFSTADVVLAPRLSKKFAEKFKKTEIKGGVMEGKAVELDLVMQLANIPETEVLYGQLVSSLIFPVRMLAMTLNAVAEKAAAEGKEQVAELVVAQANAANDNEQQQNEAVTEQAAAEEQTQAEEQAQSGALTAEEQSTAADA